MNKNMLIVFEGIDGSGKGTQSKLLADYFKSIDVAHSLFSFPCYDHTSSGKLIAKYLNGGFGELSSIPPAFPAMLYAGDRYEFKSDILSALDQNHIVIIDRYTPSNFAHQASKFDIESMQDDFIDWVKDLEYNKLQLPIPDKIILLDIAPKFTSELILKKPKRTYTNNKKDIHENDTSYLTSVYNLYKKIATRDNWIIINCLDQNDNIRSAIDISSEIIKKLDFKI